jgi:cholesterol oxidase
VPGEAIVEEIPNLHGRTRTTCQMSGECDVGCNFGAKNTLDYNYLTTPSTTARRSARCATCAASSRARAAATRPLRRRSTARARPRRRPIVTLTCDHLILSAGTLGTTNLLLRNRSAFPGLSRKLGTRFCGNGDLLTLVLNTSRVTDGVREPRIVDPGYGPVITTTARIPAPRTAARAAASTCRTPATRSTSPGSCT